jgi:hypothetical protein
MPLTLNIKNLDSLMTEIMNYPKEMERVVNNDFQNFGQKTRDDAVELAPIDEGHLRGAMAFAVTNLSVSVSNNMLYAPYIEFGTKKYAEYQVATLPPDWQEYAATFKGKGVGDYYDFLNAILDWVQRKGLAARYSLKTHKAIGVKIGGKGKVSLSDQNRLEETARTIAWSIIRNGIRATPFLYPAYEINVIELMKQLKAHLNAKL